MAGQGQVRLASCTFQAQPSTLFAASSCSSAGSVKRGLVLVQFWKELFCVSQSFLPVLTGNLSRSRPTSAFGILVASPALSCRRV